MKKALNKRGNEAEEHLANVQKAIDKYSASHPKHFSETERHEFGELLKERASALSDVMGFEIHSISD